jgi:undecaprenyl phosphate N,N'-diacetylbacillosamine 1-phosphate transferase
MCIRDRSLIGPRPLLEEYLKKYSKHEKKRHLVKPGITGLSQVNPETTGNKFWKKSFKLDVYYAKNISFLLDIKIIYKTVELVLFQKKQYKDFKKFYE